jgi:hypothetical protein
VIECELRVVRGSKPFPSQVAFDCGVFNSKKGQSVHTLVFVPYFGFKFTSVLTTHIQKVEEGKGTKECEFVRLESPQILAHQRQ